MRRLWIILPLVLLLPLSLFAGQPRKPPSEPSRPPEPSAPPWNEPDEFRGLKLGQNVRDQVRECPEFPSATQNRCWKQSGPPDAHGLTSYTLHNFGPIGDLSAGTMYATQLHDRLGWIAITMPHDRYSRLRDIVLQRYGRPTSEVSEEVVTKTGVKWPSLISRWLGSRVNIELHERSVRVDQTSLTAYTAEFVEFEQRKGSEERKKGGRDL
ncbi:MAG TPA: hypothetical protein VGC99_28785 [Candidatus Tectomicrobia bacterium]